MAQKKKTSGSKSKTTKRKTSAKSKPRRSATRGGTAKRTSTRRKSAPRKTNRSKSRSKKPRQIRLDMAQKMLILGIGIVFLTAILVLSLLSPNQGQLTSGLSRLMMQMFGWGGYIAPLITGGIGLYLVLWGMEQSPQLPAWRLTGLALLFVSFEALASFALVIMDNGLFDFWAVAQAGKGGGWLGGSVSYVLTESAGNWGAVFTLLLAATVGAILVSGVTREDMGNFLKYGLRKPETDADAPANGRTSPARRPTVEELLQPQLPLAEPDTAVAAKPPPKPKAEPKRKGRGRKKEKPVTEPAPTVPTPVFLGGKSGQAGSWKLPVMADMLELGTDNDPSGALIREQVEIIEHTLESFGAPATVIEINQGPTITQFGVEPSFLEMRSGKRTKVKVSKIAGLADDLALALHARSIRIQAPVPGKGYVGIEVPNPGKALVSLRDVMETKQFQKIKSLLRIGLGQDVGGQPITADLAGMPHLLIAGATGSGKSVMVNSIIACLLLQNTPDQLKLVMVDPKRVELTGYNGIPHLAAPVVVEMDRVIGVLQWAMREMDSRYKMFAEAGARNISDFNKKARRNKSLEPLPYIVIIIDELADLMMLAPEETERGVTRLAQLARATGIHMVIATQRPSVDVVTGLIKANF
ncbi:MAG TPA: DNA translocase FtsK, partial [Anaerolineae bacterium]|nr:DNA translocase FtsK [Anaerolineae bacterium]